MFLRSNKLQPNQKVGKQTRDELLSKKIYKLQISSNHLTTDEAGVNWSEKGQPT